MSNSVMEQKKKCPCCKRLLSFDKFGKQKGRKHGLRTYCKDCRKKKGKEYRKTDSYRAIQERRKKSDKYKEQQRKRYQTFMKKWRATPEGRAHLREYSLKRRYGLTGEEHYAMWAFQNGKCDLCDKPIEYEDVHTDHNHVTGKVRGLICKQCNHALGLFYVDENGIDNLRKAIDYIKRHSEN